MNSKKIKLALYSNRLNGRTGINDIAKKLNVSKAAVSMTASRKTKSQRIMIAIAEAIGKDPVNVWPEEFTKKAS